MAVDPLIIQEVLSCYKTATSIEFLVEKFRGKIGRSKIFEIIKKDKSGQLVFSKKKYDSSLRYILSDQDLIKIRYYLKSKNNLTNLNDIIENSGISKVDTTTLSRFLKRNNIVIKIAKNKKLLSGQQKIERLSFANYMMGKSVNERFLKSIIFTDESGFTSESGRTRMIIDLNDSVKRFNFENLNPKRVNFYGFMTYNHFEIVQISNNLDKEEFHDLLINKKYLDYMNSFVSADNTPLFIQDNSGVHDFPASTGKTLRDEVQRKHMEFVEFPPYSNDLNIIENMWKLVKDVLKEEIVRRTNANESLEAKVVRISRTIDKKKINNLFDTYTKRLIEAINNNGGSTRY